MSSITSWVRLEPRTRDPDMGPGVAARVHDPLWLLARQWQLGELQGEDAGSAATVHLERETVSPSRIVLGEGGTADHIPIAPLEAIVEAAPAAVGLRDRAEAGRLLLRALAPVRGGRYRERVLARYPLTVADPARLDAGERGFARLVGRLPDGVAAAAELGGAPLPADLLVEPADAPALLAALSGWRDELARRTPPPPSPAWQSERLAHRLELRAAQDGAAVALVAAEHAGGPLDWYAFDRADAPASPAPAVTPTVDELAPRPVRYRGMPARRYWDLEDGDCNWAAIEAAPDDAARLLLVEFALVGCDDWLVVPLELPALSLTHIRELVVTDTFGVRTRVRSAAELDGAGGAWRMFSTGGDGFFLAAPTPTVDGAPEERLRLVRDEAANLVWAVELARRGADGVARDPAPQPPPPSEPLAARPTYRLGTPPPPRVAPFVKIDRPDGPMLVRAAIPDGPAPETSLGAALATLHDHVVLLAGRELWLQPRRARLPDGRALVWHARRRSDVGAATPLPELRFDVLMPKRDEP